jgi:hypothetical protein
VIVGNVHFFILSPLSRPSSVDISHVWVLQR